jgi:hypothetical protein
MKGIECLLLSYSISRIQDILFIHSQVLHFCPVILEAENDIALMKGDEIAELKY